MNKGMKKRALALILILSLISGMTDPVLAVSVTGAEESVIPENAETVSGAEGSEDSDAAEEVSGEEDETAVTEHSVTEEDDPVVGESVTVADETVGEASGIPDRDPSAENSREYDDSVITKILPPEPASLTTEYKPALQRLLEEMPATLFVEYGGTVFFRTDENGEIIAEEVAGSKSGELAVETWECLDDYDEYLGSYRFTPVFAESVEIAEGVEKPEFSVSVEHEEDGPTGGYIPDDLPYEVPIIGDQRTASVYQIHSFSPNRDGNGEEPTSYNLFETGMLPAVRNQNPYNTCWAFASLGAVETDLIMDGTVDKDEIDLSELQLAYYTSHMYDDPKDLHDDDQVSFTPTDKAEFYLDNGGNSIIAYRAMANMVGPVKESDAPYTNGPNTPLDERLSIDSDYAGVSAAYVISTKDRSGMKKAIREHGGVAVSFNYQKNKVFYSSTYNSYYGNVSATNHAVLAVGWNDNFPRENFKEAYQPEGDGAWLIRNSWGLNGYGMDGYFWLSYYDAGLLSGIAVAYDADFSIYDNCYSYARNPYPSGSVPYNSNSATIIQRFPVSGDETVKAVGIETANADLTVEVSVTDGVRTVTGSRQTSHTGFYRVPLDQELMLESDTELTVSVKLTGSTPITVLCEQTGQIKDKYYEGIVWTNVSTSGGFKIDNSRVNGYDSTIRVYTDDEPYRVRIMNGEENLTGKTLNLDPGTEEKRSVELTAVSEGRTGD
ncbi:MAG: hypothetical protein IKO80_07850, partial [Lachnospiraceae bacterium]|nr:hypothetical protein [Lachnospiraceae bacterium]